MNILTGNELLSGATVYLSDSGDWVEDLQSARVFGKDEDEALADATEKTKKTGRIISLENEAVSRGASGEIVPQRLRERIRAQGPTAPVFERQHLDEESHVSI